MRNWRESSVADLADIVSGGTPSRDVSSFWNGGIPWVTPTDITASTTNYLSTTASSLSRLGLLSSSAKMLPSGAILFTSRASVGLVKMAAMPVCTNQGFKSLVPRRNVDGPFLFYQVERLRGLFQRYAAGSTFPEINKGDTGRVRIPHPVSRDEQRRIAAVLEAVDAGIESTNDLIAKYQRIKAGLMYDLFTRGVLPTGQLRPPLNEAPDLYQETEVGWIPSDWQLTGLQAKSRAGISWIRTGPFGSALKGEHWRTHGHPVITIGALGEGEFLDDELLFVDGKDAARLRDFQLRAGDVVFSRVADVGRSVVIREQHAGWIMSSNLMRIALDPDLVRPDYLQMQLAGDSRIKAQIRAQVNSGGRDVANSAVLSRLRFAWPDPNEQDRIIDRVLVTERALQAERRAAEKLQKQKLGLMQDLLTGRVSVEHLVAEPVDA